MWQWRSTILHKQLLDWRHVLKLYSSKIMRVAIWGFNTVCLIFCLKSFGFIHGRICDTISTAFWKAKKCHKTLPSFLPSWNSEGCCGWIPAGNSATCSLPPQVGWVRGQEEKKWMNSWVWYRQFNRGSKSCTIDSLLPMSKNMSSHPQDSQAPTYMVVT